MNHRHTLSWSLLLATLLACNRSEETPAQTPVLPAAQPSQPQLLANQPAFYPRTIQLRHQPAGTAAGRLLTSFDTNDTQAALFTSDDNGQSWQSLSG